MKVDEVCKVRRDAVGVLDKKGYAWAIHKRTNKKTARVTLLDDTLLALHDVTVPLEALWLVKATSRRTIERKLAQLVEQTNKAVDTAVDEINDASLVDKVTHIDGSSIPDLNTLVLSDLPTSDGLRCAYDVHIRKSSTILTIAHDGVTNCTTGAIVNAANEGCLGGGGIDGRIGDLGGDTLYRARQALPLVSNAQGFRVRCPTGDAKITVSGNLPCEHVIHAVGPNFWDYSDQEDALKLLADAYKNAMLRGQEAGVRKIAFCILSAGIFRGGCPLEKIVETGLVSIAKNVYPELERVYFCAFTPQEHAVTRTAVEMLL